MKEQQQTVTERATEGNGQCKGGREQQREGAAEGEREGLDHLP